jgi:DNA-binding transcriptional regulator LsrR (DeoR family)
MKTIFVLIIWLVAVIGWGMNLYKLVEHCDYAPVGKCEIVRAVGVVGGPIGAVVGYMDIGK